MKPQSRQLLMLLEAAGPDGVTARQAWLSLGIYRAAARVMELRRDGYTISTTIERQQAGGTFARYRLERAA